MGKLIIYRVSFWLRQFLLPDASTMVRGRGMRRSFRRSLGHGPYGRLPEAWGEMDPLTDRERQVLRLAGEGMSSGDIAAELSLSEGTVRNYLSEAISKMGAGNRVEAARMARIKGWL